MAFAHGSQSHLIIPQVTIELLPVLEEGEGLENEIGHEEISINIVNGDNSWTVVQKKKKKNIKSDLSGKFNKQQKEDFEHFGDIYYQEPYKSYHAVNITPSVTNVPLQQPVPNLPLQQLPVFNLPMQQLLPLQPAIPPTPLPAAPQLPPSLIVITQPLPHRTPEVCKCLPPGHSRRR
jgi:hypothetical protein